MTRKTVSPIEQANSQIQDTVEALQVLDTETVEAIGRLARELAGYQQAMQREQERLAVAAAINRAIGRTLDFEKVAQLALEELIGHLDPRGERRVVGTLQRLAKEASELVDVAGVGYESGREDVRVPLGEGVTGRVALSGEPLLIKDLSDEQWRGVFIDVMEEEIRSELAVPLERGGDVWGVLNVECPQVVAFDEDDQRLLEIVGDQILIALNNAEQHSVVEREQERLAVAAAINQAIGRTLDFDELTRLALGEVVNHLERGKEHKVVGTLQRLAKEASELMDVAGVGYESGREDVRVPLGEGVTGRVALSGEPLLIKDLIDEQWKDVFIDVMEEEIRSELAVPLEREGDVWGVLNVESPQVAAFDEDDQRLLEIVGDQILIALNNAEEHGQLEQALESAEREKKRRLAAERWAALGETAAGLSHHLGNQLGIFPLCVSEIREIVGEKDEIVTENLQTIETNTRLVLHLTGELLEAFSTGEPPTPQPSNINDLLDKAVDIKKKQIPAGIELVAHYIYELPSVLANTWLVEAFTELITNATKAMPNGGRLEIGSRLADEKWVEVWFSDTGRGIPKDRQAEVFKLFHRLGGDSDMTGGYGVGLFRVKTIVEGLDGEVQVFSEGIGKGTTFVIRFPMVER
jgi:signal transduction histidine kinase